MADAVLNTADIVAAGGATATDLTSKANLASPAFSGSPTAPTATLGDNSTLLATTAFVFAGLNLKANLDSPALTGAPTAPTQTGTDNSTKIATTAFVAAAVAGGVAGVASFNGRTGIVTLTSSDVTTALTFTPANIASPAFTGNPTAATQSLGNNSTRLATTAYADAAATAAGGVNSFNTRTGAVTLTTGDVTGALTYTPTSVTTLTGVQSISALKIGLSLNNVDNTSDANKPVSTATQTALNLKADLASPALTGNPTAPTQTAGNNSTRLATTAYTDAADALKANLASPTLTGTPLAPTATGGTNTTQIATTAFVTTAVAAAGGVASFNTRTGAVTLSGTDVTTALSYTPANIASPTFTGSPAAPTPTFGDNTTLIATTAFVQAAVAGGVAGVASFNTRTGVVTLTSSDVTTALTFTPVSNAAVIDAAHGGTGQSSYAIGDLIQASASTTLSKLAAVATGSVLISGGVTTVSAWGKVGLTTHVSGTLPVANGGTGITALGTGVATALGVNVGSAGAFVTFNGALGTPSSATLSSATGLPISTGVSGLGTNVATFLATPTSANMAAAVTDETGTGALVFAGSPALTGSPTTPTQSANDNSTKVASTAYVDRGDQQYEGVNAQTGTTYTFVLTDHGKLVTGSNASAITWTIPLNSSVAFLVGDRIDICQVGAGQITIAATGGVTILSSGSKLKLTGQYSGAGLTKIATDTWLLVGDIAT